MRLLAWAVLRSDAEKNAYRAASTNRMDERKLPKTLLVNGKRRKRWLPLLFAWGKGNEQPDTAVRKVVHGITAPKGRA